MDRRPGTDGAARGTVARPRCRDANDVERVAAERQVHPLDAPSRCVDAADASPLEVVPTLLLPPQPISAMAAATTPTTCTSSQQRAYARDRTANPRECGSLNRSFPSSETARQLQRSPPRTQLQFLRKCAPRSWTLALLSRQGGREIGARSQKFLDVSGLCSHLTGRGLFRDARRSQHPARSRRALAWGRCRVAADRGSRRPGQACSSQAKCSTPSSATARPRRSHRSRRWGSPCRSNRGSARRSAR